MRMKTAWRIGALPMLFLLVTGFVACGRTDGTENTAAEKATATPYAAGATQAAEPRDPNRLWCKEHGVYEDECVICHPELAKKAEGASAQEAPRDPNRLWCNEHGLYEDECVICHPELANAPKAEPTAQVAPRDPNRLWCNEHGVYEDECYICHPELKETAPSGEASQSTPEGVDRAARTTAALMCKEHGVPEAECGICHPDLLAELPAGKGLKVRFASGASASKAGVTTSVPFASPGGTPQELAGQITFNRNSLAAVTPLVGGVVVEVLKDVGDTVNAEDVLAVVKSVDVAKAKSEYAKAVAEGRLAHQVYEREKTLHEREISARRDMEEAQAVLAVSQSAIEEARQHLLGLGLSDAEAKGAAAASSLLPVRSPLSGTVVERKAVQGTAVEPGEELFQVADLSSVWMQLSVPETRLVELNTGAPVRARFDAYPGMIFEGEVQWIAPRINPDTRMLEARAVFPNAQGLLKDGLFGHASLGNAAEGAPLTVPSSAVQDVDGQSVVFRKLEDDLYETRVEVGAVQDGRVVVLAGLAPGEELVTEGSYVMKSELLKARLGAGCTDH